MNPACILALLAIVSAASAFVGQSLQKNEIVRSSSNQADFDRPSTFLDEDFNDDDLNVTFLDEDDNDQEDVKPNGEGRKRWENLNPKIKQRLIERGQAKAIANKKKREPAAEKKRRMLMHYKKLQQEQKRSSRIERPLGFEERAPLSAFPTGMEVTGTVISLTNYGAYVDVGTECDGLLHISQITRDFFVEHPRQALTPGEEILVKVRSSSPELKKLQLTMLAIEESLGVEDEDDDEERIQLNEIEIDDELWGELKRVTDFGAFVEVGAEVDGFLHFMDHPSWENGMSPSEFMHFGDRVRVWVSDVDMDQRRVKLTANRPSGLPGPKREM
ncbi:unnamed protein product [Cylindrotheca closterium]|uniref:S1 motif domain-containing protein n=1 Tax=Cylindrotheca closterium TaxID=2856 RepID=A0AAD2FTT8_9STRA|nr:unnamed protein product [Cylindrotheca closterium]